LTFLYVLPPKETGEKKLAGKEWLRDLAVRESYLLASSAFMWFTKSCISIGLTLQSISVVGNISLRDL